MEKVVFYKVYYFEDTHRKEKYYFEDKTSCEIARFCAYKKYDKERLTIRKFIPPVTEVKEVLINENDINNYTIYEPYNLDEDFNL